MPQLESFDICTVDNNTNDKSTVDHQAIGKMQYTKLNLNQKDIVDKVMSVVMQNKTKHSSSCSYINGPGG